MASAQRRPEKRVTITDIAERAGVSIGAVSFALKAVAVPAVVLRLMRNTSAEIAGSGALGVASEVMLSIVVAGFGFFVVGALHINSPVLPSAALSLSVAVVLVAVAVGLDPELDAPHPARTASALPAAKTVNPVRRICLIPHSPQQRSGVACTVPARDATSTATPYGCSYQPLLPLSPPAKLPNS